MNKYKAIIDITEQLKINQKNIGDAIDGFAFVKNFIRDGQDIQFTDDFISLLDLETCLVLFKTYTLVEDFICQLNRVNTYD